MEENGKRSGTVGALKLLALVAAVVVLPVALGGLWSAGVINAAAPPMKQVGGASGAKVSMQPAAPQTCDYVWQTVSSPNGGPGSNHLNDVDSVLANNIWAVGYYANGSVDQTLVEHWNGTNWSVIPSPNVGSGPNHLNALMALASNDIWAVGYEYDTDNVNRNLAEHWDGTNWSVVATDGSHLYENIFSGVTAVSSSNVYAVGYQKNTNQVKRTMIQHWNGSAWTLFTSPNNGTLTNVLTGVAEVAYNDIWAIGYYGNNTLTEHWNGSAWSIVYSPVIGSNENELLDVDVVGSNDVWAVGYYYDSGHDKTLTLHWNGVNWVYVASPNVGTGQNQLVDVSALGTGDVWAVGHSQSGSYEQTLTEHWTGASWAVVSSPNIGTSSNELNGVRDRGSSDVWAVGNYYNGPIQRTLIEHYSLVCVTPSPTVTPGGPTATPTATSCPLQFSDVPSGSTFYDYVRCMACRNIVNGYTIGCETGNPCFRPNNNVTRGQLAKIVANAAGFGEPGGGQLFEDVAPGSTFYDFIYRLASRGYIGGYPCGGAGEPCNPPGNLPYFRPNNNATRGQIAKIDSNAAGFNDDPSGQQFEDVAVGSTYYTYTYRLVSRSIMSGYLCGGAGEPCNPPGNLPYFRPNNNATRGQTSKIVANTFFPGCVTPFKARK